MRPWLILPFKSVADGKSRLRSILPNDKRYALNQWLLTHALSVAQQYPGLSRTILVSPCEIALSLGRQAGAHVLAESDAGGLNTAVSQGVRRARQLGADVILICACDLPLMTASDLRGLFDDGMACAGTVIVADHHHRGTNAVFLPPHGELSFQFGPASLRHHCEDLRKRGCRYCVATKPHLSFDLDEPSDFRRLPSRFNARFASVPTAHDDTDRVRPRP